MADRLARVRLLLDCHSVDALVISSLPDVRWACGFTGSSGLLIVSESESVFITDGRYVEQARREVRAATTIIADSSLTNAVARDNVLDGFRRIAFQGDHVTHSESARLVETASSSRWISVDALMSALRSVKDEGELASHRKAQALTESVFDDFLGIIRPGMTEAEMAAEIVYGHLRRGAERMAFEPIVASGENSALPHARPGARRLGANDVLLLDFGCVVDGYASDMTRTVSIGDVGDEFERVYAVVRDAQQTAIDAARAGMTGAELDASARDVIEAAGYGESFSHSLGHGIGLETHEWPRVSRTVDEVLPEGCLVTVEPGVYLSGKFGVRIEDIVHLHSDGCTNLTSTRKDLIRL